SKASACLLHTDPRSRYLVRLPAKLPGMHYSADEQCQILFGTNATFCTDMEGQALSLYLTDPTPTITDHQRAVVSSMSHPVSAAPSADGCTTQDYMHTDRYHDCP
ncbi:hypothetical protein NFI96_005551, partial [Prochilodus magdalenae]